MFSFSPQARTLAPTNTCFGFLRLCVWKQCSLPRTGKLCSMCLLRSLVDSEVFRSASGLKAALPCTKQLGKPWYPPKPVLQLEHVGLGDCVMWKPYTPPPQSSFWNGVSETALCKVTHGSKNTAFPKAVRSRFFYLPF